MSISDSELTLRFVGSTTGTGTSSFLVQESDGTSHFLLETGPGALVLEGSF
jgi:hypothetical protein